jgi:hypothetical protein
MRRPRSCSPDPLAVRQGRGGIPEHLRPGVDREQFDELISELARVPGRGQPFVAPMLCVRQRLSNGWWVACELVGDHHARLGAALAIKHPTQ